MTKRTAPSAPEPAASAAALADALTVTSTAPVGESIPLAIGGRLVRHAIHMPETAAPTSIAQIAMEAPAASGPGNISAANETMLATSTTAATDPLSRSRIEPCTPVARTLTALRSIASVPSSRGVMNTKC